MRVRVDCHPPTVLPSISTALGEEVVTAVLRFVFEEITRVERKPGYLWEWAEDRCRVCGAATGHQLRWLHTGRCDTGTKALKN